MNLFARLKDEAQTDLIDANSQDACVARIAEDRCLAYNQTLCTLCFEKCPLQGLAIVMKDFLFPVIIEAKCNGCRECVNFCPTTPPAIRVVRTNN